MNYGIEIKVSELLIVLFKIFMCKTVNKLTQVKLYCLKGTLSKIPLNCNKRNVSLDKTNCDGKKGKLFVVKYRLNIAQKKVLLNLSLILFF